MTSRDFLKHFLDLFFEHDFTPLTAAIATELVRSEDVAETVAACAWMANKYEDIYPLELRAFADQIVAPVHSVSNREPEVLNRIQWRFPHTTPIHEIRQLGRGGYTPWNDECLYVLLHSGLDRMYSPRKWAAIIDDAHVQTRIHPALQLVISMIRKSRKKRYERVLKRVLPRRISRNVIRIL